MIVHAIRYHNDTVTLHGADQESVSLTYDAWTRFLQYRGTLSIPFRLDYVINANTLDMRGDTRIVITDANALH